MKRDLVSEILLKKERNQLGMYRIKNRLFYLELVLENCKSLKDPFILIELNKYFPIALVACMEIFFRTASKEIIDAGPPFIDRVEEFKKMQNFKLDFKILHAMQGEKITVGDIVSHSISLNNLDNIDSTISALLDKQFLKEIETFEFKIEKDNIPLLASEIEILKSFQKAPNDIFYGVKKVFELRHIYCHEAPLVHPNEECSSTNIRNYFESVKQFLVASYLYILNLLYPNEPLTQTGMNIRAGDEYKKSEKELEQTYKKLLMVLDNREQENLKIAQEQWEKYRDINATFFASRYEGGTIQPLIHWSELKRLNDERTEELEGFYKDLVEKYES